MLTVNEAATRLNVSARTVRNLINSGTLPHHRIGVGRGVIRISEAALEKYLADCEVAETLTSSRRTHRSTLRHIKL